MKEGQFDNTLWINTGLNKLNRLIRGRTFGAKSFFTIAYRCPNCNKIELYTEDVKDITK